MTTESVLYIVLSIPWAVAGFLAGFTAGVKANLWSRTMSPVIVERPTETPSRNPEDGPKAVPWYRRSQIWIGGAVAAIGIVTGVQWYATGEQTKKLTECTAAYAAGFSDALERRTTESQRVTDGQDKLWLLFQEAVNSAPSPDLRERFRVQINEYFDARAASKKAAIENPYPEPPRDVCH